MSPAAALVVASCLAVNPHSDYITAGDIAATIPAFQSASPETHLALAPAPGVRRTFLTTEIQRIGGKLGITVTAPSDICFERRLGPLDESAMRTAMQRTLPEARIAVLSYRGSTAPEGELEFPMSGLYKSPSGTWWKGFVRYGNNHRYLIWAKVEVLANVQRIVANGRLTPGVPVTSNQVRMEKREEAPTASDWALSPDQIVGRIPRRPIAEGAVLDRSWFDAPKEISRGDHIRVDVWSGNAHLEFEGTAEASGSVGQTISVLNPESKRRFQARVEGPGRASIKRDKQ
jgi:flagella basal body P-ring formation protein FlgA